MNYTLIITLFPHKSYSFNIEGEVRDAKIEWIYGRESLTFLFYFLLNSQTVFMRCRILLSITSNCWYHLEEIRVCEFVEIHCQLDLAITNIVAVVKKLSLDLFTFSFLNIYIWWLGQKFSIFIGYNLINVNYESIELTLFQENQ